MPDNPVCVPADPATQQTCAPHSCYHDAGKESGVEVRVERSERRVRTVSARVTGDIMIVRAPARMTDEELAPLIASLRRRLERKALRPAPAVNDESLAARATALSARYFGGKLRPRSIRWVTNQGARWGSCTPATGTIRLSHALQRFPAWVVDSVIVHELAHLQVPGHGPAFWVLANRYPLMERARGFLIAKSGRDDEAGWAGDDAPEADGDTETS
jgi:predicted metal-dependent hydrolase